MKVYVWRQWPAGIMALVLAACMVGYAVLYPTTAGAYATDRPLPI